MKYDPNMTKEQFFEHIGGINRYMLLDRMRCDCDYWLGNGYRHNKYLWAGDPVAQIRFMKWLWESFAAEEKPEWLTMEQINNLGKRMNGGK